MRHMRTSLYIILYAVLFSVSAWAQSPYEYTTNPNLNILDNTTVSSSITITDAFTISDLNVMVDVEHPWCQDLIITLAKSGGPTVILSNNNGGGFPAYRTTIFDDQGNGLPFLTINSGAAGPFNGIYVPQNPLGAFTGSGAGTWTLSIQDNAIVHEGKFKKWGLIFNRASHKDYRDGLDLNTFGVTRHAMMGWVDNLQTIPPFSVQGVRPLIGVTLFGGLGQNSSIASITRLTRKQIGPGGNTLFNGDFDASLGPYIPFGLLGLVNLSGAGRHNYTFGGFQRWGLFMAREDDNVTLPIWVTPASLGYDDGVMRNYMNFGAPECDVITAPIYQTQLLTSIDVYQGPAVELEPPLSGASVAVNLWATNGIIPTTILATSFTTTLPPQGDKWVTYGFNPPVSVLAGYYAFGMCVVNTPLTGGIAMGMDEVTSNDYFFGRYEGIGVQWYSFYGTWYEDFLPFVNKMIRPNFITGTDVGVFTINSPNGTSSGPQSVNVTFKSYNHQPQLPNILAQGKVTIRNSQNGVVYTSEKRVYLTPWGSSTVAFDNFSAPAAGTYTVTAEINRTDDENLVNNSYTRTFTLLSPIAPIIVSEDGSLTDEQRLEIATNMKAKGLEVKFQNHTSEGLPFENTNAVIWVGDTKSLENQIVQSYVERGNYFGVLATTYRADLGEQLIAKLTTADEVMYNETLNSKMAQALVARNTYTSSTKPKNKNTLLSNDNMIILANGDEADLISQRVSNYQMQVRDADRYLENLGPAPKNLRKAKVGNSGSVKVRESLFGSMTLAEVVNSSSFNRPVIASTKQPTEFALEQNYPNPFNPTTNIAYTLPVESYVTIKIYDVLGREVATLLRTTQNQGRFIMQWDGESSYGSSASSGVYFYRLEAIPTIGSAPFIASKKMVLAR